MRPWQKVLMLGLVASFPAGLLALRSYDRKAAPKVALAPDVETALKLRASELAETNMHIVATQGELLKYESRKREIILQLEQLREKIGQVIESAAIKSPGGS